MKPLLFILILLLNGCATTLPVSIDNIPKVNPSFQTMGDCPVFVNPKGATFDDYIESLVLNKQVWASCNNLNQSKKEFIINSLK